MTRKDFNYFTISVILGVIIFFSLFYNILINKYSINGDFELEFFPLRSFSTSQILNDKSPVLNPYVFNGWDQFSALQDGMLYPSYFLSLIFPVKKALYLSYISHLFLIFLATYILCYFFLNLSFSSSILSAICFSLSGYISSRILAGALPQVRAYLFIPVTLIFLIYIKNKLKNNLNNKVIFIYAALFSLILFYAFLAGYTPIFIYINIFAVFFILFVFDISFSKKIFFLIFTYVLFFLFSAIQSLPHIDSALNIIKNHSVDVKFSKEDFILFLFPDYYGNPIYNTYYNQIWEYWEKCVFIGIIPFFIIFLGLINLKKILDFYKNSFIKKFIILSIVLIFSGIIFAFSDNFILIKLLYKIFPFLKILRVPTRALIYYCFFGSLLTGIFLDYIAKSKNKLKFFIIIITVLELYKFSYKFYNSDFGFKAHPDFKNNIKQMEKLIPENESIIGIRSANIYNLSTLTKWHHYGGFDALSNKNINLIYNKIAKMPENYRMVACYFHNINKQALIENRIKYIYGFKKDIEKIFQPEEIKFIKNFNSYYFYELKNSLSGFILCNETDFFKNKITPLNKKHILKIRDSGNILSFYADSPDDSVLLTNRIFINGYKIINFNHNQNITLLKDKNNYIAVSLEKGINNFILMYQPNVLIIGTVITLVSLFIVLFFSVIIFLKITIIKV